MKTRWHFSLSARPPADPPGAMHLAAALGRAHKMPAIVLTYLG